MFFVAMELRVTVVPLKVGIRLVIHGQCICCWCFWDHFDNLGTQKLPFWPFCTCLPTFWTYLVSVFDIGISVICNIPIFLFTSVLT